MIILKLVSTVLELISFGFVCINPLLNRHSFLRLLQQTTFENIVTKEEIVPAGAISSFPQCFQSFPT